MKEEKKAIKIIATIIMWFVCVGVIHFFCTMLSGELRPWEWVAEIKVCYIIFSVFAFPLCILTFFNDNFA